MEGLKIHFSGHALIRIKERKITRSQVKLCLKKGLHKGLDVSSRNLTQMRFGGRILEVVSVNFENEIVVVTAYWKG